MQIQQQNQQSHEKNEFLSKEQQNQLEIKFEGIKETLQSSNLSPELKEDIQSEMDNALNKCYIYIVIMGTQSTGKSTFLNALLGHELLTSKTQNCTSKVTYIGHQNVNANQNTNITINEKNFDSVKKAAEYLVTIRDNPQVKIRTQSYFHRNLSQEYQDRIIFVDTPGIQLVNCTPKKDKQQIDKAVDVGVCPPKDYKEQIDEINEQIQLDEHSIRINVWVSDYTTFDRDKEIQKNIISKLISSAEQYQQPMQNHKNNQNQQSNKVNQLFFIINKFDQRSKTKDDSIEDTLKGIKSVFNSENIFKISASQALNYNILNYGTEEDTTNFINEYFENNKESHNLQDIDDAGDYCKRRIKNNHKLIQSQDFNELITNISTRIELEVNEKLNLKINSLKLMIRKLILEQNLQKDKNTQTLNQKANIRNLLETFQQKQEDYKQKLQQLQIDFVKAIDQTMNETLTKLEKQEPQAVKYFIEQTNIELNKIIHMYQDRTKEFNRQLLEPLVSLLNEIRQISQKYQIEDFKSILDILMEDSKFKEQTQQILTKALELYSEFGNDVIISENDVNDALSAHDDNAIRALIGGATAGGCYAATTAATFSIATGGISIVCGAVGYGGYKLGKWIYKSYQLKEKLKQWNEKFVRLSKQLADLYINMYEQNFKQIKDLIE